MLYGIQYTAQKMAIVLRLLQLQGEKSHEQIPSHIANRQAADVLQLQYRGANTAQITGTRN